MMADGGNTIRGIDVLRHQRDLLGEVASPATVCRALAEADQQALDRIDAARATVRARVWELIAARHGRIPPARMPTGDLGEQIITVAVSRPEEQYERHISVRPAVPEYCRWTPADRVPFFTKPVSSAISTPAGSPIRSTT
jgi:hypothetical protein